MSRDARLAQDRTQSFLRGTTQQGATFVPSKESRQSRAERVNRAIQAVDHQFDSPSMAQQQGQGGNVPSGSGVNTAKPHRGQTNADLNGIGGQFHDYTRH